MEIEDTLENNVPFTGKVYADGISEADDFQDSCSHVSYKSMNVTREADDTFDTSPQESDSCFQKIPPKPQSVDATGDRMSVDSLLNQSDVTSVDSDRLTDSSQLDSSMDSVLDRSTDESLYQTAEENNTTHIPENHRPTASRSESTDNETVDVDQTSGNVGDGETYGGQRKTQDNRSDRMSVDSILEKGDGNNSSIIYNREDRMSVDSIPTRPPMLGDDIESPITHRRPDRMSVDTPPRQQRLKELINEIEKYFEDEKYEEAEKLVQEQYIILEVLQSKEEERHGVDMAEMFLLCATYSSDVSKM